MLFVSAQGFCSSYPLKCATFPNTILQLPIGVLGWQQSSQTVLPVGTVVVVEVEVEVEVVEDVVVDVEVVDPHVGAEGSHDGLSQGII